VNNPRAERLDIALARDFRVMVMPLKILDLNNVEMSMRKMMWHCKKMM
jgi:hypothetical protein